MIPTVDWISTQEAALLLGVTRQRVVQMVTEGKLPRYQVGRSLVFDRAVVQMLAARR